MFEIIPLIEFALQILEKYQQLEDRPLPKLSEQKVNVTIKKCCKKAEIKEPIAEDHTKKQMKQPGILDSSPISGTKKYFLLYFN